MSAPAFRGVITALVTPFQASGALDQTAFETLLELQKAAGIHGVIVGGTTGESPNLSDEELEILVKIALKYRSDSFAIYVGSGSNSTDHTVKKSCYFKNLKGPGGQSIDGIMAVVPYYNKPNQSGLHAHFSAVAKALHPLPLCVYNVPGRTSCTLAASTFVTIASEHSNVVAIKEAAGDIKVITELVLGLENRALRGRVRVLSGDDLSFMPALVSGADGVISVASHIVPWAFLEALRAAEKNDFVQIRTIHSKLFSLNRDLFCAPNPVPVKWFLAQAGICRPDVRLPLTSLLDDEIKKLQAVKNELHNMQVRTISYDQ